jgi:putative membrane protein
MNLKSRISLFFKGFAMGTVDIVPGVSGSTVAVLLNIYERFIAALKNINKDLIVALLRPFAHKFDKQSRQACKDACIAADLPWLVNLLLGLFCAFIVASFVIPALMMRFPEVMRGFFFGLVLGSVITPLRQVKTWRIPHFLTIAAFASIFFFLLGQQFNPPAELVPVTLSEPTTLKQLCSTFPCLVIPSEIQALPQNVAIQSLADPLVDTIAANTTVFLPRPSYFFCLAAGFVAICAMLLPGISGSFVLLILGSYFFMLNTGKSFMHALLHGDFLGSHLLYLGCFVFGALAGIAVFSRVLTWLFKTHRDLTLCAIIGILIGCLRGVWPYRITDVAGIQSNVFPSFETPHLWQSLIAMICALGIVIFTVVVQKESEAHSADK